MSEQDDRNRVFRTTRVRTSLKNDVSWIQKSAPEKNEEDGEDGARTEQQAAETRPGLLRLNSYVLSTTKKFESLASPQSSPDQNTHFIPSKGPQAPTEELIQRGEEQPEKSLANTTAGNKEENADQSNVELNGGTTEVSVDIHVNEHIFNGEAQPVPSTKEAGAPAEHPVISTTAENKGEYADTADDQSNVEQSEVKVSADAHVESPAAETFAAAGTEECKDTAEILLKPQEEASSEIEPANATKLEGAGVEPTVQHAERSCEKCPPEAVIVVVVESSPDESDVINETPEEEAAVQQIVEPVADLVADFVSELPPQPAAEAATEGGQDEGPPEKASEESVEAVVAVEVESSPNESDVVNATPEEEATVQQSVESVPDLVAESVSKLPPQLAAPAKGSHDKDPPEQAVVEIVETITEVNVASVPEAPAVIEAAGEEAVVQQSVEQVPDLVVESVSELPPEPAAEAATEGSHDKGPPEQAAEEAVNPETEVNVASSPAVTDAAGDDTAVQDSVEQIPDLVVESVSELPPQPAVGTAAISAASTEPVLQTRAEEVVECEVQPANNTVVEQSIELPHESTAGRKVEPCIEDALEPTTAPEAEAAQEFTYRAIELTDALDVKPPAPEDEAAQEFTYRAIELTDALDVEPPAPEAEDEPLKSPKQSHTEEMTPAISDMLQKPVEEPPSREILESISVCSVCDKIIGNIKISFSEPPVIYHPECLKCGVCDKALGDMLTPMFLHNQVIQCDGCFAKTHKTSSLTGTNMSSETTQSIL